MPTYTLNELETLLHLLDTDMELFVPRAWARDATDHLAAQETNEDAKEITRDAAMFAFAPAVGCDVRRGKNSSGVEGFLYLRN